MHWNVWHKVRHSSAQNVNQGISTVELYKHFPCSLYILPRSTAPPALKLGQMASEAQLKDANGRHYLSSTTGHQGEKGWSVSGLFSLSSHVWTCSVRSLQTLKKEAACVLLCDSCSQCVEMAPHFLSLLVCVLWPHFLACKNTFLALASVWPH